MAINYPELGGLGEKKNIYVEGDEITHPSGNVYKRLHGSWRLIRLADGTLVEPIFPTGTEAL